VKNDGILLLHGFAGNIEEVKPLRDYLMQKGYLVECPLLPGHGQTKKELSKATCDDWITSAEQAYLVLSRKCSRVFVIGFSMGGLLAVNLWNYGFAGMVIVNMPVYYWNPIIILSNLFTDFKSYGKKYFEVSTDKSISSMIEFLKLLKNTKPMLDNVTCKTMVIQAWDDDTVHYKSADYILKRIRGEKAVLRPTHGGHMIFQSKSSYEVCEAIGNFVTAC